MSTCLDCRASSMGVCVTHHRTSNLDTEQDLEMDKARDRIGRLERALKSAMKAFGHEPQTYKCFCVYCAALRNDDPERA